MYRRRFAMAVGGFAIAVAGACSPPAETQDPGNASDSQVSGEPEEAHPVPNLDQVVKASGGQSTQTPDDTARLFLGVFRSSSETFRGRSSLEELVKASEIIVIGFVTEVRLGREVRPDVHATSRRQYVEYAVEVVRGSTDTKPVVFELPVRVWSPTLDEHVRSAQVSKAPDLKSTGDVEADRSHSAVAYDMQLVEQAYLDYWDEAVSFTLDALAAQLPSATAMFFLSRSESPGVLQPTNTSSIVVEYDGLAVPLSSIAGPVTSVDPVSTEISGMRFDELIAAALGD